MNILLATQSPLYMPLYLAWLNSPPALRRQIDFVVDGSVGKHDSLVRRTLSTGARTQDIVLAVGDLLRLRSYLDDKDGFDRPVITGGLVDRVCFWLIDGLEADRNSFAAGIDEFVIL